MADQKPKRAPLPMLPVKKDIKSLMYTSTKKAAPVQPPNTLSRPSLQPSNSNGASPFRFTKNGMVLSKNGTRKSTTPTRARSRNPSSEPREIVRNGKSAKASRASPVVHSPQFSEDEDEDESDARRKRIKIEGPAVDAKRKIRDHGSFSEEDSRPYDIVHAADIANVDIMKHGSYQFAEYFTQLGGDEEEHPTIELQYPCIKATERYQLVRPTDRSDFKPLDEIKENMRIVREFYLDTDSSEKVEPDEGFGGGIVGRLERHARDTKIGAQTAFVNDIEEYNQLLVEKRNDDTIAERLDTMTSPLPLRLVNHIIKEQIYSRTISPEVDSVREYKGFSDNVYGELLPMFLSKIFKETGLTSEQIFVDLGSGVGNCVLQAALEIGCDSWGCEVMPNPSRLARSAAAEFTSRCRMWGIKPGKVRIIENDFLADQEIGAVLKKADVVLINNQAFTPALNDNLKRIFLDLKEGCKIVSLKYFRDPNHRVKESNINDLVNCLSVQKKERFSGMVSWTDDPGDWYLHVKDSTELRTVQKRIGSSNGTHSS